MSDLASARVDRDFDRLVLNELLIAKALKVSEIARIAKLEQRLRQYLHSKWEVRQAQAAKRAGERTRSGASAKAVAKSVNKVMGSWSGDVTKRFNVGVAQAYKLNRQAAFKKAKGATKGSLQYDTPNLTEQVQKAKPRARTLPSFTLADERSIAALEEQNTFWIGNHYGDNISESISEVTRDTLAAGTSRRVAALTMQQQVARVLGTVTTPGGFHGSSVQYFEGLTANAVTVARGFGAINSFVEAGITHYVIVNPEDERTCPVCSHMEGKRFSTRQGADQMGRETAAEEPDDIKTIHPWLSTGALLRVSSTPGRLSGPAEARDSAALASAGQALPPYHFRCRCAADIEL